MLAYLRMLAATMSLAHILSPLHTAKGQEYTHTSLGPPFGSYYVPGFHVPDFLAAYRSALERGDDLHLTERRRHIGPVIVDLDLPSTEDKVGHCQRDRKGIATLWQS